MNKYKNKKEDMKNVIKIGRLRIDYKYKHILWYQGYYYDGDRYAYHYKDILSWGKGCKH